MKKIIILFIILFLLCDIYAQNNNDRYSSIKPQYGFIENKGQVYDQNYIANVEVKYLLSIGNGMNVQLKKNSFSYDTYKKIVVAEDSLINKKNPEKESENGIIYYYHRVDVEFIGANADPEITAEDVSLDYLNYYNVITPEKGATKIRNFKKITYKDIYPGIDIMFEAHAGKAKPIEYTFIVHPGADANLIRIHYIGANETNLSNNKIKVDIVDGSFTESIPLSWIKETNNKLIVTYKEIDKNVYGFNIPSYSNKQTLIIDPNPNLEWGTYYGGNNYDYGNGITCDKNGNVFITGKTQSSNAIATSGAYQNAISMYVDAFIAKFNNNGICQWATYYGGSENDYGNGVSCDSIGNVFIVGRTASPNVISTIGAHQLISGGGIEAFIVKFNNNGARIWGTYFGGNNNDYGTGIACDKTGNIFITGYTKSTNGIATLASHQDSLKGGTDVGDAFIAKFNNNGVCQWGTYYGGANDDAGYSITCDENGNVFIIGSTQSTNFIATSGANQISYGGGGSYSYNITLNGDAFVVKFDNNGIRQWGSYYGGSGDEYGLGIKCDKIGNVFIGGITTSNNGIATIGAHQTINGGSKDAFIAKFNNSGARIWGTYYGGSNDENPNFFGMTTDSNNNIFITGATFSTNNNSIATTGAFQTIIGGGIDAFVAKFNNNGERKWGTYYGGNDVDISNGIKADDNGNLFITGYTASTNAISTPGAHQTTIGGLSYDVFLTKFYNCDTNIANAGIILGDTIVCQGQNAVNYVVPTIANATSYIWTLPNGFNGSSNTNSIFINFGTSAVTGNILVKGHNPCGDGNMSTLTVNVNTLPASAGLVSGSTTVCQGQNTVNYNIPPIPGATTYSWIIPVGIIGSSNTNNINVNFSSLFNSGNIIVCGTNICGNGDSSAISVNKHIPDLCQICYVEYDTLTQKNKVFWSSLSNSSIDSIFVYREINLGNWNKIGSVLFSDQGYVDNSCNPMNQSYNYKISAIDTCNNESLSSLNHKTITLIKSYDQLSNSYGFMWSGYEGLTVSHYNVYGIDANNNITVVGTVPGNNYLFNYTNPNPLFLNYFVGFDVLPCTAKGEKSLHIVKSNYVNSISSGVIDNKISFLKLYPNPANNQINVEINQNLIGSTYTITDQIGKIVLSGKLTTENTTIQLGNLSGGIYLFNIGNNAKQTFKVLKN